MIIKYLQHSKLAVLYFLIIQKSEGSMPSLFYYLFVTTDFLALHGE